MCPKCGAIRYARESQKTAKCFGCGYQILLEPTKVRILAKARRSKEAIAAVQELKMQQGKKDFE
jgi:DNA-directed RNA polymerase subunit M/transcription elongation factor TFIIS